MREMEALTSHFLKAYSGLMKGQHNSWGVFQEVLETQLPLPDGILENILGIAAQHANKCGEEQANTLLKIIGAVLTKYTGQAVKMQAWPMLYVVILSACIKHASILPVSNKRLAWPTLVQLCTGLMLKDQLQSVFPGVYLAACTEVLMYRDKTHGATTDCAASALNVIASLFESFLKDTETNQWVEHARSMLIDKVAHLVGAVCKIVKDSETQPPKLISSLSRCVGVMLECRGVFGAKAADLVRCIVELHKYQDCSSYARDLQSDLLEVLETLWRNLKGKLEGSTEKLSTLKALVSCFQLGEQHLPTYMLANTAFVTETLSGICTLEPVKVSETGAIRWERLLPFTGGSQDVLEQLQAVLRYALPGIEEELAAEVRLLSKSASCRTQAGLSRLATLLFLLRQSAAYLEVSVDCKEIVISSGQGPSKGGEEVPCHDQSSYMRVIAELVLEAFHKRSQAYADKPSLVVDCLQLTQFAGQSAAEILHLDCPLHDFIEANFESIKVTVMTRLGYSNLSILKALTEIIESIEVAKAEDLVSHVLKAYDRRHHRFTAQDHLAYLSFYKKLLLKVKASIEAQKTANGNLMWLVMIRLRPLLSWKGNPGDQRRLAGEVLELLAAHCNLLDRVAVEINTSQIKAFEIEDACNAAIPRALPFIIHEFLPALLSCAKVHFNSPAVLLRVIEIFTLVSAADPRFLVTEQRLRQVVEALAPALVSDDERPAHLAVQTAALKLLETSGKAALKPCSAVLGRLAKQAAQPRVASALKALIE